MSIGGSPINWNGWGQNIILLRYKKLNPFSNDISLLIAHQTYTTLTLIAPGGGGTKCPDPFHIAIAVFFFSRKRVFLLFDFYYFGVRQYFVTKKMEIFLGLPSVLAP